MYKKIKILLTAFLTISTITMFCMNNTNQKESLTQNDNLPKAQESNTLLLTNQKANESIKKEYYKVAENDNLELYVNNENLGLKIKNKGTGYVWNSTLDESDKNLNKTWQAFAKSAVTIEYMDEKNKIRQLSMTKEKAKVNVLKKESGFKADVIFDKQGIKLSLEVTLEKDSISIKIPASSIEEKNEQYKIQTIILYPFFGASKGNDMDGYMFIPDGSGALVSLSEKTLATQPFIGRVYGKDLGITGMPKKDESDNSTDPQQIYMPVFGMNQKNDNGYVAFIEEGDPYTEIQAYPAGVTTGFNWISSKFIYREAYFQPIDKKGNAITVNKKDRNSFDACIKYMFLSNEDSSYVGMAKRYQKELLDKKILKKMNDKKNKEIPVRVEFYAADNKKEFLWKKVVPMTTVKQMDSIIKDLQNSDVNNMSIFVNGWSKGGVAGSSPIHFPFEKKVGTSSEWKSFIKNNEEKGIPVYMYANFVGAYGSAGGYKKNDISQAISEKLLSFGDYYSYLNPNATARIFNSQISKFDNYGINNIALGLIGNNLNSTYNKNNTLSRKDTVKTYEKMLLDNKKFNYALYEPNQYLWNCTSKYLDIPMNSSNFILENEEVPFMQMVLNGYIDYYAPASNFYSNSIKETLKLIDYGAFPSFFITNEDPVKLLDTETEWLYTSQYSVWKNEIINTYGKVNKALSGVKNAHFENRVKLKEGVYKNTYSNGASIVVNYTDETYKSNDIEVQGENFKVIGGVR